jgi:hypothetical protein
MKQGYSGSSVQRKGNLVKKISSDQTFMQSKERQQDLTALSWNLDLLPRIDRIDRHAIYMEYVDGREGLTEHNVLRAGAALRRLHDQRGYPHECMTGVYWLIEMANENLARMGRSERIPAEIEAEYPCDALIHSEPTQLIEKNDGSIVFIDFEGIGMGSRCQDIGFIYYLMIKDEKEHVYNKWIAGYQSESIQIDFAQVKRLAGIISLAYAGFAEFDKRMNLGFRLLGETGQSSAHPQPFTQQEDL